MKILFTIHQFFPEHYTGTEKYLLSIATMMKAFGHEVSIITYMPHAEEEEGTRREGELLIREYVYQNLNVTGIRYMGNEAYVSFDFEQKDIEAFLRQKIAAEKPDLIHITHPMRLTSTYFIAKEMGIKTVMTLTDYWVMCGRGILIRGNNHPCMSPKEGMNCKKFCYPNLSLPHLKERVDKGREMLSGADAIIVSAQFLADLFKLNDYDMSKMNIIRHGFNYFQDYDPIPKVKHDTFTFACLGSLLPHKGADLLINAFKKLEHTNARLAIYGEAYEKDYFEYLKVLAGNDTHIEFRGKYTAADTHNIHKEVDVIVSPSTWYETYPLVGVAALAYGVPLIVPDLTGSRELVDEGKNGYIFGFNDEFSLAEKMEQSYTDNLKLTQPIFYPYTIEQEAVSTEQIYYNVLNE